MGAVGETVTGKASILGWGLVVILLALALAIGLVAVGIKALTDSTVTGATYWVPPPAFGARKVNFVLTILSIVAGPTLAGVASRGVRGAHTGCHMLAGVQETCVHTLFSKVPSVTDAGVAVPCVTAVAMWRAGA